MTPGREQRVGLMCHPWARCDALRSIEVTVRRAAIGTLTLVFRLDGDTSRILVPSPRRPRSVVGLWQHTCLEAFVAVEGQPGYYELNFAPSGEWAVYAFHGYRVGGPIEDEALAPGITVRTTGDWLELKALVSLDRLSAAHGTAPLRIGLAAVVETKDGTLSYWALRHPPGKPDFHHADAFALRLDAASPER